MASFLRLTTLVFARGGVFVPLLRTKNLQVEGSRPEVSRDIPCTLGESAL